MTTLASLRTDSNQSMSLDALGESVKTMQRVGLDGTSGAAYREVTPLKPVPTSKIELAEAASGP